MKELYDIKDSSYTDQKFDFNSYLFHRRVCFRYINIFHDQIIKLTTCNRELGL